MRWPFWAKPEQKQEHDSNYGHANGTDNNTTSSVAYALAEMTPNGRPYNNGFSRAQTVIACILTTGMTLIALRTYKTHLRRIPNVTHLKPSHLRSRSLYGYVTSVGDGDNFRVFHTPGGRMAGWGWLPGRRAHLSSDRKKRSTDQTIHVRIAGVDAPECSHFGRPAQPFSTEALEWLRGQVLGRYVRVWPWRKDQYERVVCTAYVYRLGLFKRDVGLEMLKAGLATIYEAKFGSEFGDKEEQYRLAEDTAKQRGKGMWQQPGVIGKWLRRTVAETRESPREYKTRMKKEDQAR